MNNNLNNKKTTRSIEKLLTPLLFICILITFIDTLKEVSMEIHNVLPTLIVIIISIGLTAIQSIGTIFFYILIKLALKTYNKDKLDETDFEKNKNYYREIIQNYDVEVLNYIDNFNLDYKQSYAAKLLELQKNNIIEIKENSIKILNNPEKDIDKKFVDSIKDNKITMSISEYENLVAEEALKGGLITKNDKNKNIKYIVLMFVAPAIYSFLLFSSIPFLNANFEKYILPFSVSFVVLSIVFFAVFIFSFAYLIKSSTNPIKYKRTKLGKEINTQLEGLKLFMKDFGDLHNKQSEHIVLWEDYLIYSVMFNQNTTIKNEYEKYISSSVNN